MKNLKLLSAGILLTGICSIGLDGAVLAGTIIQSAVCGPFQAPTLLTPVDGSTTAQVAVAVTGQADPDVTVSLINNGQAAGSVTASDDGSYGVQLPLMPGQNKLFVQVVNPCGTAQASPTITVVRALPPSQPQVLAPLPSPQALPASSPSPMDPIHASTSKPSITQPLSGSVANFAKIWVRGTAPAGTIAAILINGKAEAYSLAAEDGGFAALVTLRPGVNIIVVQVVVNEAPSQSQPITVTYQPKSAALGGLVNNPNTLAIELVMAVSLLGGLTTLVFVVKNHFVLIKAILRKEI